MFGVETKKAAFGQIVGIKRALPVVVLPARRADMKNLFVHAAFVSVFGRSLSSPSVV
jgi:hypothetical protein